MIELDGAVGEGGGQVLRSALTLSMMTGQSFKIKNIRAKRPKPGLLRQHLTAVEAAAAICGARVEGAAVGSQSLSFIPGPVQGGDYRFAIGTAGSCTLVLQTILPALWFAKQASRVSVSGGTHNKAAPPADFLIRVWQPLLAKMGVQQDIALKRYGFYPAGGGEISASVKPISALTALHLGNRGALQQIKAEALVAGVPGKVAQRELDQISLRIEGVAGEMRVLSNDQGPGNAVLIEVVHEHLSEIFTGFGEKGTSAEAVGNQAASLAKIYLESQGAVGEYLADQLLLSMALAGAGSFTCTKASSHLLTNIGVIERFLAVKIICEQGERAVSVSITSV